MKKEKLKDAVRFYLQQYNTKGNYYRSHEKLSLAINSLLKVIPSTLKKADFTSRIRKFDTDMKTGKSFKKASDDFLSFINTLQFSVVGKNTVRGIEKASKIRKNNWEYGSNMGKGGRRKIDKEKWNSYINAERILFRTEAMLKAWGIKIESSRFLTLIGLQAWGETDKYDEKTRKLLQIAGQF